MAIYDLKAPFRDEDICALRIGDQVTLTGEAFTCRSKLQRTVFDENKKLPDRYRSIRTLIHTGPIVNVHQDRYELVSFMPTSSDRFEKWGARSVREWNLQVIVGKTTMGPDTMAAMKAYHCVHLSPQSVSPNLWLDSIRILGVNWFDEMGSIEAPWLLELDRLGPFVVDIDTEGNNLFDEIDQHVQENKLKVYKSLGIPEDFKPTKLY